MFSFLFPLSYCCHTLSLLLTINFWRPIYYSHDYSHIVYHIIIIVTALYIIIIVSSHRIVIIIVTGMYHYYSHIVYDHIIAVECRRMTICRRTLGICNRTRRGPTISAANRKYHGPCAWLFSPQFLDQVWLNRPEAYKLCRESGIGIPLPQRRPFLLQ